MYSTIYFEHDELNARNQEQKIKRFIFYRFSRFKFISYARKEKHTNNVILPTVMI